MDRRRFVAGGAASALIAGAAQRLALAGGEPVRRKPFPAWPVLDEQEEKALLNVLRSRRWNRGSAVERFETEYAKLLGSGGCLATANGTSALLTALHALGVGPGTEVIVPPYTFVATINVVLEAGAVPVFVDTDRETFQIDANKIEAAITPRTAAIMPVHLGGNVADLDRIVEIAKKRDLPVIEDACQAHLAEWQGRKAGSVGTCGAFSFQASKNLNCGEGGALVSSDTSLLERAFAFHNNGRGRKEGGGFSYERQGLNLRLTEFQAALLLAQMSRLGAQTKRREENAAYLTSMLAEIPGIRPAKMYRGCTRNAYHLYMFRYDAAAFDGLPRETFLRALRAEGIPAGSGYSPLNRQPFIAESLKRRYSQSELASWTGRNECPENDRLCTEAVWFVQTMLLGPRGDMDDIAAAVAKVRKSAGGLAKT
jgi:dTDP-4-amino-4,6-dideoxygalactose transaminase